MARFRYQKRQLKRMDELPLTPLVDTALTLLVVFMIAAPTMHNGIKVDLPRGSQKEDSGISQKITLIVDKAKELYLGTKKVTIEKLSDLIMPSMMEERNGVIYLQADQELPYGFIFDVVDRLRSLEGVKHVILVSKK